MILKTKNRHLEEKIFYDEMIVNLIIRRKMGFQMDRGMAFWGKTYGSNAFYILDVLGIKIRSNQIVLYVRRLIGCYSFTRS